MEGRPLTGKLMRFTVVNAPVEPGEHIDVTTDTPHPAGATVKLDIVSELVAWSSQNGVLA